MKIWKVAALIALATIPLFLLTKKKMQEKDTQPAATDSSEIFEWELTSD